MVAVLLSAAFSTDAADDNGGADLKDSDEGAVILALRLGCSSGLLAFESSAASLGG